MIDNPWHVDDMARMQRERVQEEMRQIRFEEKALKARVRGPGPLPQVWLLVSGWFKAKRTPAGHSLQRPAIEVSARQGEAHI